jgi:hypothetical protein
MGMSNKPKVLISNIRQVQYLIIITYFKSSSKPYMLKFKSASIAIKLIASLSYEPNNKYMQTLFFNLNKPHFPLNYYSVIKRPLFEHIFF